MPQHFFYLKAVISDNTDRVHQIGTAYLVQHCLCCNLFCIDVKEQRDDHSAGRDEGQIISTGEPWGLQVSLGQETEAM